MKQARCKSGLMGWKGLLHEVYTDFEQFEFYCDLYSIHTRLGYKTVKNVKRMTHLKTAGYKFEITADGYSVSLGTKFLGGASVTLPRSKPLHWRHRNANIKDNVASALATVDRFLNTP